MTATDGLKKIESIRPKERHIQFILSEHQRNGKLKSKLIHFDNGTSTRVYWNSKYEGEPK